MGSWQSKASSSVTQPQETNVVNDAHVPASAAEVSSATQPQETNVVHDAHDPASAADVSYPIQAAPSATQPAPFVTQPASLSFKEHAAVSTQMDPSERDHLLSQIQFLSEHLLYYMYKDDNCDSIANNMENGVKANAGLVDSVPQWGQSSGADWVFQDKDIENILYNPDKVDWTPTVRDKFVKSAHDLGVFDALASYRIPECGYVKVDVATSSKELEPSQTVCCEADMEAHVNVSRKKRKAEEAVCCEEDTELLSRKGKEVTHNAYDDRLKAIGFLQPLSKTEIRQRRLSRWKWDRVEDVSDDDVPLPRVKVEGEAKNFMKRKI